MNPCYEISESCCFIRAPSIWSRPCWVRWSLSSLMSCTWAKRHMHFPHSVVLCSSVYVCTPWNPNICSKGGNGSGYIDHNYIVFLPPLHFSHSIEFGDPVLDQFPLEEVCPTHHILVHYDSPCKYRIIICDMRFGAFVETLDTVHEKWLITVCGPRPALMSCFCRSDFQVLVLRVTDLALQHVCYCYFFVVVCGVNVGCRVLKPEWLSHNGYQYSQYIHTCMYKYIICMYTYCSCSTDIYIVCFERSLYSYLSW